MVFMPVAGWTACVIDFFAATVMLRLSFELTMLTIAGYVSMLCSVHTVKVQSGKQTW